LPFELLHSPCGPSHLSQELSRLTLGHPTHYGCTNIVHLSVCSAILGWRRGHRRNHRFGPAKTLTIRSSSGQFCRIERGVACSPIQALLHFDRHLELGGVTYKPLLDVKRTDDRRLPLDGILGEADGVLRVLFLRETYGFLFLCHMLCVSRSTAYGRQDLRCGSGSGLDDSSSILRRSFSRMLLRTWCICGNLVLAFKKAGYLRGDLNIRLSSLLTLNMLHRPHRPGQQPGSCGGAILPAPSLS